MLSTNAFTLIELLIVLIIIAIMIVVAVPRYGQLVNRAYEGEILSSLSAVRAAQRAYRARHGAYPTARDDLLNEDMPLVSGNDFEDMKFVEWLDFNVDGKGNSVWRDWDGNLAGKYKYSTVELGKDGSITRG